MNPKQLKVILISMVVIILVTLLGFVLYDKLVFRVLKTSPQADVFPTSAPYIDIYLSKPVTSVESYTLNDTTGNGTFKFEDKRLRFEYNDSFQKGKTYTFALRGITSKSGDKINFTYTFNPEYIEFNKLPEDIKQASIEKSSSGQIDDPFFNNQFPIHGSGFNIDRSSESGTSEKILLVTFLIEVYDYDTNTQTKLSDQEAEAMRTKVFDYIKSLDGKPDEYEIHYSNQYLEEKYNKDAH